MKEYVHGLFAKEVQNWASNCTQLYFGEGKRRNEFEGWLAEWHNYAECKIWKMAQIWVSNVFAGPFVTAGFNQQGKAESSVKLYCILLYVILS